MNNTDVAKSLPKHLLIFEKPSIYAVFSHFVHHSYSITDNHVIRKRKTRVGNMNYIVNSIFDINSKKTLEDHIRRLIAIDIQDNIEKVS